MAWKIYNSVGEQRTVAPGVDVASLSGVMAIANGGTGQADNTAAFDALAPASAAKGDVLVFTGTHWVRKAVGSDNQYLKADSAQSDGTAWSDISSMPDSMLFGNGRHGNATANAPTTMIQDLYYVNLTIGASCAINTAGYRIHVSGILDISAAPAGWIKNNGGNGSGSGAGSAGPGVSIGAGIAGGAGATIIGVGAIPAAYDMGGGGGAGGTSGGQTGSAQPSQSSRQLYRMSQELLYAGTQLLGGDGGSGGSMAATGVGGGGGGGAGIVYVAAKTIARGTNTQAGGIIANGGNGAAGQSTGTTGGGGGGGGGGGLVYLIFKSRTGSAITNHVQTTGGSGGAGGNGSVAGGSSGASGDCGRIILIDTTAGTYTEVAPNFSHTASNPPVGGTGGVATTGATNSSNL